MWRVPSGIIPIELWNLLPIMHSISLACPAKVCSVDFVFSRNTASPVRSVL